MNNIKKKPFGLTVAVKVALEAMHDNIAPSSIILSNLFFLQKATVFPKNLDNFFFSVQKHLATDNEKKATVALLDELKKPQINKQELLETLFAVGWVIKKQPLQDRSFPKIQNSQRKTTQLPKKKENTTTIVIKKNKPS